MSAPIWIVENEVNFRDIINNESFYIDAWIKIVQHWLLEPARNLSSGKRVTDRGMALLTLELAFFEPFGSLLTGKDSDRASRQTFLKGLTHFANWLFERNFIGKTEKEILSVQGNSERNLVYEFARCGLMHSMTMKGGRIFIDAVPTGQYSMTDYNYPIKWIDRNDVERCDRIFLIDPWRLLSQLESFLKDFECELRGSYPDGELYKKFRQTFERTFVHHGRIYLGMC